MRAISTIAIRCTFALIAALVGTIALLALVNPASAEMKQSDYDRLPREVRDTVQDIRSKCRQAGAKDPSIGAAPWLDAGLQIIDLDGKGSRDILLDAERVCVDIIPGANCTNRGCDLKIWKQTDVRSWKKVFDEHLHRKFISLDHNGHFVLMAVSVFAGHQRCATAPNQVYTSGQSCDALLYFQSGTWIWKVIQRPMPSKN